MQYQGKDVFIVDLHVPPTWLAPNHCDARLSLPVDSHKRDALISPLWIPGHFVLCVMKPLKGEILFLDSQYHRGQGFAPKPYQKILRALAQHVIPGGAWSEFTGQDIEGLPKQLSGNDCGVFMLMYTWYVVMEAPFDFTIISI
ncbi:hypothetical protein CgunFtcFv8_021306 [Champsocephalus gunnari]|uniref:Ubiquitin-like protease family profile domain-containing protein n=1 Tax=Champsocephalus gunnari TaxID=52237 RepID=A0AAN8EJR6_CHAGU|nr:hypothetical protein CgunFtcFv8_021306 [Champsocephalus gunnari]